MAGLCQIYGWPCYVYLQLKMPGRKGTITVHGNRKIALECEEGDAAYAESACATEELTFYKDNVDLADMTPLKKPSTEQDPLLKFKSADDTKQIDFVPGDSAQQFTITTKKYTSVMIRVCHSRSHFL